MKKILNTKVIAIVLLAFRISFTSCNRKKKTIATISPTVLVEEISQPPNYLELFYFIVALDSTHELHYTSS